jgi:hypothetical protein
MTNDFEAALRKLPKYMRDTDDGRAKLEAFWQAARAAPAHRLMELAIANPNACASDLLACIRDEAKADELSRAAPAQPEIMCACGDVYPASAFVCDNCRASEGAAPAQPTLKKLLKDFEGFPDYSGPGIKPAQPRQPDPALIESMCMRYRHDWGLLDDERTKEATRTTMRQLWEEVVGIGFYKAPAQPAAEK